MEMGYINNKNIVDVGCGRGSGSFILRSVAKSVVGVDPQLEQVVFSKEFKTNQMLFNTGFPCGTSPGICKIFLYANTLEHFVNNEHVDNKHDAVVGMEVIEHVDDPLEFVANVASVAPYAFLSTPRAKITGKTRNPDHVAEYSSRDMDKIMKSKFKILKKVYQDGTMRIANDIQPNGDSANINHTVQMYWLERK